MSEPLPGDRVRLTIESTVLANGYYAGRIFRRSGHAAVTTLEVLRPDVQPEETTVDPGREDLRERIARAMHTRNIGEDCWEELLKSGPKRQVEVYRDAADAVLPIIDELHERARRMADVANSKLLPVSPNVGADDEMPEPHPMRTWQLGDPQPDDVTMVRDSGDRRWCLAYTDNSWYLRDIVGPVYKWDALLRVVGPLTEVRLSSDVGTSVDGDFERFMREGGEVVGHLKVGKVRAVVWKTGVVVAGNEFEKDDEVTIEDDDGGRWYVTRSTLRRASDVRDEVP